MLRPSTTYIFRLKSGDLGLCVGRAPKKGSDGDWQLCTTEAFAISPKYFPFIIPNDEEPWSVKDLLELEVMK